MSGENEKKKIYDARRIRTCDRKTVAISDCCHVVFYHYTTIAYTLRNRDRNMLSVNFQSSFEGFLDPGFRLKFTCEFTVSCNMNVSLDAYSKEQTIITQQSEKNGSLLDLLKLHMLDLFKLHMLNLPKLLEYLGVNPNKIFIYSILTSVKRVLCKDYYNLEFVSKGPATFFSPFL